MRSGEIGPGKAGGLRRLALTDADKEMRDLFVTWCTEAGCTVTIDRVGNIFARRPGRDDHLPPVLMGSHLDTQVAGGKYDGIVGVLAGLEVLRTLDERRVATKRAARARVLDQRGRRALHAAHGRLRRLRRASSTSTGSWPCATTTARCSAASWSASATTARPMSAAGASTPTSSCTSSRARSSTARRCPSASWSAATPRAACTSTSTARPRTRARRRWTGGATRWWAPPCWPSPSTTSAGSTTPPRARPRWPAWWPGPTRPASCPSTRSSRATCATPSARWPTGCGRK